MSVNAIFCLIIAAMSQQCQRRGGIAIVTLTELLVAITMSAQDRLGGDLVSSFDEVVATPSHCFYLCIVFSNNEV